MSLFFPHIFPMLFTSVGLSNRLTIKTMDYRNALLWKRYDTYEKTAEIVIERIIKIILLDWKK